MIRIFDKGIDAKTLKQLDAMATSDIKTNKIAFGQKTYSGYVNQVVQTSRIVLGRTNK